MLRLRPLCRTTLAGDSSHIGDNNGKSQAQRQLPRLAVSWSFLCRNLQDWPAPASPGTSKDLWLAIVPPGPEPPKPFGNGHAVVSSHCQSRCRQTPDLSHDKHMQSEIGRASCRERV